MPEEKTSTLQMLGRLAILVGLLLVLASLVVWAVTEPDAALKSPAVVIPAGLGALLFVAGCAYSASWLASIFLTRRAAVGLNVAFMVFFFIVVVVIINIIGIRHYVRWDWTEQGLFTLSSQTVNVLGGLEKKGVPLKVTTLLGGSEHAGRIKGLMDLYSRQSARFKVSHIDVFRNKQEVDLFIKSLKEKPTAECVVFQYGDAQKDPDRYREKIIDAQNFLEYPPMDWMMMQMRKMPDPRFKGEEVLTSAIMELSDPDKPKVYFTKGHGEADIEDFKEDGLGEYVKLLKRSNFDAEAVDLMAAGEVPDNCAVLVVAGPRKPFDEKEVRAIRSYLDRQDPKAGRLLLLARPLADEGNLSSLRDLLKDYNVRVQDNQLVIQQAVDLLTGQSFAQLSVAVSDWGNHAITKDLKNVRGTFYLACPVQEDMPTPPAAGPDRPQGPPWQVTTLATSSRRTWGETSLPKGGKIQAVYNPEEEQVGPFNLAVAVQRRPSGPGMPPEMQPPSKARLVVVGEASLASNRNIRDSQEANQGFMLGAVNWLADREYSVGIPPKIVKSRPLTIGSKGRKAVTAISWFGLPLLVALAGGGVLWWRRR